jgi:RHS repeat-associated protein
MKRAMVSVLAAMLVCSFRPAAAQTQETVTYYHVDAIGSVRMISDAAGQVVARYDFLPFGEAWDPPAAPDVRQFAGKERDAEIGFDYFGARYYQSQTGRFTSVDPGHVNGDIYDPQSWNGYAYARNNPLQFTDSTGTTYEICAFDDSGRTSSCGSVSDQYFANLYSSPGAGIRLWGGAIFIGDRRVGYYTQTSVDPTFNEFARLTGELSSRWLREQSTQMAVGAAIAATGGLAAGAFSGGLETSEVLGIGRIAAGVHPSPGQIAQMQQVFARQGRAGVEKALRSLERRLAEHLSKIDAARSGGGVYELHGARGPELP